jgi:threonine dehydrogenase-like Zn-dependent dehydrogenase
VLASRAAQPCPICGSDLHMYEGRTGADNRKLRDLILAGRAEPGRIVTKEIPLAEAPEAYRRFDNREEGYSKVLLHP